MDWLIDGLWSWLINHWLINHLIDWLIDWLAVWKMVRGFFFSISALDSSLVWYQNLIDWSLIMIWSLQSWFDWLINTLYSINWHSLHWFIPYLYVFCCSVTNISAQIYTYDWEKYSIFSFLIRKNEWRMSYSNTRFAIASNSWGCHPVLDIVTVAATSLNVPKSQGTSSILYTCLWPPFFYSSRRIRLMPIYSWGTL